MRPASPTFLGAGDEEEVEEDPGEVGVMAEPNVVEAAPTRRRVARKTAPPADAVPMVKTGPSVIAAKPELPPLPGLFDSATPGIIPPGTDNIRLHTLEAEQVPAAEPSLVEVIVSAYGEVERAKLISVPGDVHEAIEPCWRGVRPDHRRVWRQKGDVSRFRPTKGPTSVTGVLEGDGALWRI